MSSIKEVAIFIFLAVTTDVLKIVIIFVIVVNYVMAVILTIGVAIVTVIIINFKIFFVKALI
jgi:hypothetical protein